MLLLLKIDDDIVNNEYVNMQSVYSIIIAAIIYSSKIIYFRKIERYCLFTESEKHSLDNILETKSL